MTCTFLVYRDEALVHVFSSFKKVLDFIFDDYVKYNGRFEYSFSYLGDKNENIC